ncbi:MAG: hypothetical protein ONB44_00670 [candidate division KSB1 bacterium]|nr:hypothetical protein [candidate division KSB1 bacterium]MDZ7300631.1 hypothetical protein [candidate division KSB1 bacterium]MDZ7309768.1 hypothetical protein [candidate division KSB1 bacterium]
MERFFLIFLSAILLIACRQQQPATTATTGLRKISYSDPQTVERVRQSGVKILVQQPDYLIVYSDSATAGNLQALAIETQPATERDLVQRLASIHFADQTELQKIINLGVDFWSVEGDSVIARVFDLHLEQLQQQGFTYRIMKMDASAKEDK